MSDESFIKKPCKHCPYRIDVKPFLTPERGEELAYLTENPFNDFTCHKTIEHDDEGETVITEQSKTCAGFLTLSAQYNGDEYLPEGFEPSWDLCYSDASEMEWAYSNENEDRK